MPYIGEDLCGQGWVQQVVVSIFISLDYEVHSYFLPWKRAVAMTEMGEVDALYPEYNIALDAVSVTDPHKYRRDMLIQSAPFPGGNVAFVKRRDSSFEFSGDLQDIIGQSVGVVAGYENSPEFDALMRDKLFFVSESVDDWTNIRKLHAGRVGVIVVDPAVLESSAKHFLGENNGQKFLKELQILQPYLISQPLHLAFSANAFKQFPEKLHDFNRGLSKLTESGKFQQLREYWLSRGHLGAECISKPAHQ